MIDLEKFLEPIELAGTPLKDHRAYRMDGESPQPDMRKDVGLGPCIGKGRKIFSQSERSFIQ